MRKIGFFIMLAVVSLTLAFTSCGRCTREAVPSVDSTGLDVQSLMVADYDYVAGQYENFLFYEGDVHFNKTLDSADAIVDAFRSIFQVRDTCVMIDHRLDRTDTFMVPGIWVGCSELNPRMPVTFDSCMALVAEKRAGLQTQYVTFRRMLAPPFPKYGWWIFGKGLFAIDSYSGEPIGAYSFDPDENLRLGCPLGEWP